MLSPMDPLRSKMIPTLMGALSTEKWMMDCSTLLSKTWKCSGSKPMTYRFQRIGHGDPKGHHINVDPEPGRQVALFGVSPGAPQQQYECGREKTTHVLKPFYDMRFESKRDSREPEMDREGYVG